MLEPFNLIKPGAVCVLPFNHRRAGNPHPAAVGGRSQRGSCVQAQLRSTWLLLPPPEQQKCCKINYSKQISAALCHVLVLAMLGAAQKGVCTAWAMAVELVVAPHRAKQDPRGSPAEDGCPDILLSSWRRPGSRTSEGAGKVGLILEKGKAASAGLAPRKQDLQPAAKAFRTRTASPPKPF